MDRVKLIADIIESSLSGQYGRDTAEKLAEECVAALSLPHPKKYQMGRAGEGEILWLNWFVYAETEELALVAAKAREQYYPDITIVRFVENLT